MGKKDCSTGNKIETNQTRRAIDSNCNDGDGI